MQSKGKFSLAPERGSGSVVHVCEVRVVFSDIRGHRRISTAVRAEPIASLSTVVGCKVAQRHATCMDTILFCITCQRRIAFANLHLRYTIGTACSTEIASFPFVRRRLLPLKYSSRPASVFLHSSPNPLTMPQRNPKRKYNASAKRGRHANTSTPASTTQNTPATKRTPPQSTLNQQHSEDASHTICSICAEKPVDWAVGHCGHVVCGDCFHRMRVLYERNHCVMCKEVLKGVVLVPLHLYKHGMKFEQGVALPGAFHDKQVNIWFIDHSRYDQLRAVRGWKCSHKACTLKPPKNSVFPNAEQLRAHARAEHRAVYCNICFNGRKAFVSELELYPLDKDRNFSSRHRAHMRKVHPMCKFCRKYFLDDDALYNHLQEKHETCTICERNGRLHEYYATFEQLERHYEHEHYVCQHDSCRGVVFATNIELQAHIHTRHNDNARGTRSRTLRVNLHDLHREERTRRPAMHSPVDEQRERNRQAARRRAFLSSHVVFSGALDIEPNPTDFAQTEEESPSSVAQSATRSTESSANPSRSQPADAISTAETVDQESVALTRRPDDGRFHPLALPRDAEERQARNTVLVRTMRSLLEPAEYEQFRSTSSEFQKGTNSAEEYYDSVVDAFGVRAAVRDILPELVALLPNPLLREPLLQVCLRRTNTSGSQSGYLDPSGPSATSQPSSRAQNEQFPTLSDAPPPRRMTPKTKRFGDLGPEEFPRLGRVNRTEAPTTNAPNQTQTSAVAGPSSSASAPSSKPYVPQKTAASVLREPPPKRVLGHARATGAPASGSGGISSGALAGAFPALSSTVSNERNAAPRAEQRQQTRANSSARPGPVMTALSEFPSLSVSNNSSSSGTGRSNANAAPALEDVQSAEVTLRAGPVWGGAGGRGRGGKRRGTGNGRRPATPPTSVVLASSSAVPDLRLRSSIAESGPSLSSGAQQADTPRRHKVIDVMQIAKARKEAMQKSNVPKIGGSGYGFAWDRKKVQQKKREIKSSMNANEDQSEN